MRTAAGTYELGPPRPMGRADTPRVLMCAAAPLRGRARARRPVTAAAAGGDPADGTGPGASAAPVGRTMYATTTVTYGGVCTDPV
ncbi:hypothetical protein ACFVXE_12505 [Streptomyces sp. NPDC058231]|uniref:hypothetical protein n=1 Tax=Streptomyces sp. NPDC058231 TaxID=3346392 RepID=UPI0036E4972A